MHLLLLLLVVVVDAQSRGSVVAVTDENWAQILEGEWMVEFFAPWCPACRNLQSTWESFATWSADLDIRVGQVDITSSPGLSGRFMITALPTIYHVSSGVFRQYKSPRTAEDFLSFVEEKKWEKIEPISAWQSPASVQMSLLSQFYRLSMGLRNVMSLLTEGWGVPVWGAYVVFGAGTILVGLLLGLLLVFIIDCIYPQPKRACAVQPAAEATEPPPDDVVEDSEEIEESAAAAENSPAAPRKRRPRRE